MEEYELKTWRCERSSARLVNVDGHAWASALDLRPCNWCPSFDLEGPVVNVGYGAPREIDAVRANLPGAVAVMFLAFEPFTTPVPHTAPNTTAPPTGRNGI